MKKFKILCIVGMLCNLPLIGQENQSNFFKPIPANYEVKHAVEVESIAPMFLYGGYHLAAGYRYKKFRIRASVINGGSLNLDGQSKRTNADDFTRNYNTGAGIFAGYNVWKNLEIYGYLERHSFHIKQVSYSESTDLKSIDSGIGLSYQFFLGRYFYFQPGIHSYFRNKYSAVFPNGQQYEMVQFEIIPVIRIGVRLYKVFETAP